MPIRDSTHRQVIRTDFDFHSVAWQDSYIVHSHFATNVSQHFEVAFVKLHAKSSIWQVLQDCAIQLNAFLLSRLISRFLLEVPSSRHESTVYQGSAQLKIPEQVINPSWAP